MSDRTGSTLTESRALSLVQGSYATESPQDLRQLDERDYVKRLKDEIHLQRQLVQSAYPYRQLSCNEKGDDHHNSGQYVTLQASPSSDGVEFVTLEDFFVADPSTVYEQIIPPHSPNTAAAAATANQNESMNVLSNYMSQTELQNGGCIIHLEPVMPNLLNSSSFVNLPTEPMPYDQAIHESRVHFMEQQQTQPNEAGSPQGHSQSATPSPASNHPVPVQIVRPQQHLKNAARSKSMSCSEDMSRYQRSPPNRTSTRKRSTRTLSLNSSSDEGSLMNLSMSSGEGKMDDYGDDEGGKHRRCKQPVPESNKDEKYWRRREKNNLAAKRSREARKQKESQTTERAAFLEEQHELLKKTLEQCQRQNEELRQRLSKYENIDLPKHC